MTRRAPVRPVALFRLYPERQSRFFCSATVWPTLEAMRAAATWESVGRRCHGFCSGVRVERVRTDGSYYLTGEFAQVHLAARWLRVGIISHEFTHAAIAWGRRRGFGFSRLGAPDSVNEDEERFCYVQSELVRQFIDRAYGAGLIR